MKFLAQSIRRGYRMTDLEAPTRDRRGRLVWTLNNVVGAVGRGNLIGGWGSSRDITGRKEMELQLRLTAEELRQAQRVAHVGTWVWDTKTDRFDGSSEIYRSLGVDRGGLGGSPEGAIERTIHPDDQAKVRELRLSAPRARKSRPSELRVVRPDGTARHIRVEAGDRVRGAAGSATLLTGIIQDIIDYEERRRGRRRFRDSGRLRWCKTRSGRLAKEVRRA